MLLPEMAKVGSTFDLMQWSSLLKSVSAYDMYLKKHGKLTAQGISGFLIFDKNFPRSILSCIIGLDKSLQAVTVQNEDKRNEAEKQLGLLRSHLEYSDVEDVFQFGVHEYLDDVQSRLNNLSISIFETYFSIENNMYNSIGSDSKESQ